MKKALTLSEVLIAMVIIGVVAAITIPAYMSSTEGNEYRSALKKAISVVNQALVVEYSLNGLTAQDYVTAEELTDQLFKARLQVIDGVSEFTTENCEKPVFTTADGMIFCVDNYHSGNSSDEDSVCNFKNTIPCVENDGPNLWIDVNGVKKPNKNTIIGSKPSDVYQAQIYANKVIPYGLPTNEVYFGRKIKPEELPLDPELPETKPETPETPTPEEPEQPEIPDFDMDDDTPDEDNPYYGEYDPNKWPSWLDFLRWLLGKIYGIIFG